MRDTIIFTGASNTFGLGLEIEFRDKYNDDKWLEENGLFLPLPREPEDVPFWKEYRWSKIVSDELGMVEYNIHDQIIRNSPHMGGNAIETMWVLNRDKDELKPVLDRTKYIIFEMGFIRWWDEKLHGLDNSAEYPNTILEIIDLINNKNSDGRVIAEALDWIKDFDEKIYWNECFKKYKNLKEEYPEIEFIIVPWASRAGFLNSDAKEYFDDMIDTGRYPGIYDYLINNKLTVGDAAKAFNGNYKYNRKDDHPSSLGHRHVANFVINHINKNNNLETIPYKERI